MVFSIDHGSWQGPGLQICGRLASPAAGTSFPSADPDLADPDPNISVTLSPPPHWSLGYTDQLGIS